MLRAKIGLEKAQNRHKILRDFTGPKKIKTLKSSVETARSNELAKQAIWELEAGKEKKLERHDRRLHDRRPAWTACFVMASSDSAKDTAVGERQLLFTIAPATDAESEGRMNASASIAASSLTSFNNSLAPPKMRDSLTPIQAHLAKTPIEAGGAQSWPVVHLSTLFATSSTLFDAGTASGLSDRQLLERFSSGRDVVGRGGLRGDRAAARADGASALL